MQTVEIHLPRQKLTSEMAAMRMWLDERRFEPATFTCHDNRDGMLVAVTFGAATEAEAFANRFTGRVHNAPPAVGFGRDNDLVG